MQRSETTDQQLARLRAICDELLDVRARETALIEARDALVEKLDNARTGDGRRAVSVSDIAAAIRCDRERVRRLRIAREAKAAKRAAGPERRRPARYAA